jgi:hypothetical protein
MPFRHVKLRNDNVTFGTQVFRVDHRGYLVPPVEVVEGGAEIARRMRSHPNYVEVDGDAAAADFSPLEIAKIRLQKAEADRDAAQRELAAAESKLDACVRACGEAERAVEQLRGEIAPKPKPKPAAAPVPKPAPEPPQVEGADGDLGKPEGLSREALEGLSWDDLRTHAKSVGVPAGGKTKDEIIAAVLAL